MSTEETLDKLVKAWNDQDIDTIVATFAADGSYHEPAGPDSHGRTHTGPAAIRRALEKIFHAFPDGRIIPDGPVVIAGDHAHCEWDFEWSANSGEKRRVRGVDIFTFEGGKLKHKSAYLKQFVAAA
jgi:hypothetical protein